MLTYEQTSLKMSFFGTNINTAWLVSHEVSDEHLNDSSLLVVVLYGVVDFRNYLLSLNEP